MDCQTLILQFLNTCIKRSLQVIQLNFAFHVKLIGTAHEYKVRSVFPHLSFGSQIKSEAVGTTNYFMLSGLEKVYVKYLFT